MSEPLRFEVALPIAQAYALAELCKRLTYSDARGCAVDADEARCMICAADAVREALARAGVTVR